jgi:hypothetical protein
MTRWFELGDLLIVVGLTAAFSVDSSAAFRLKYNKPENPNLSNNYTIGAKNQPRIK